MEPNFPLFKRGLYLMKKLQGEWRCESEASLCLGSPTLVGAICHVVRELSKPVESPHGETLNLPANNQHEISRCKSEPLWEWVPQPQLNLQAH